MKKSKKQSRDQINAIITDCLTKSGSKTKTIDKILDLIEGAYEQGRFDELNFSVTGRVSKSTMY